MKMIIHTREGKSAIAQSADDDIDERELVDLLWRAAAGMNQWDMAAVAGEMIERADQYFEEHGEEEE